MYMSVEIGAAASSMSESLSSLESTPLVMHRIWFDISSTDVWYSIQREAKKMYGTGWKSQSRVKRKLDNIWDGRTVYPVWFDVPDQSFASWISVKYAVSAKIKSGK
jgi:hypothetical protein